jgi:hypothetical protein
VIVVEVVSIKASGGIDVGESGATLEQLKDHHSLVTVRPLEGKDDDGDLMFSGESSGKQFQLGGPFVRPLVLNVGVPDDGVVMLHVEIDVMTNAAAAMWLDVTAPPGTLPSLLVKCSPNYRHRDSNGHALFQVGIEAEPGLATVLPSTQHICAIPGCNTALVDANHAVNHSAYHMLHTPQGLANKESCAICLGPASGCPAFLLKTTTPQPRIVCSTFSPGGIVSDPSTGVSFTTAGMSKSTLSMPSTNIPIVCPVCNPGLAEADHKLPGGGAASTKRLPKIRPAVMKYNFRSHWEQEHPTLAMPAALQVALELSPNEKALLGAKQGGKVTTAEFASLAAAGKVS